MTKTIAAPPAPLPDPSAARAAPDWASQLRYVGPRYAPDPRAGGLTARSISSLVWHDDLLGPATGRLTKEGNQCIV